MHTRSHHLAIIILLGDFRYDFVYIAQLLTIVCIIHLVDLIPANFVEIRDILKDAEKHWRKLGQCLKITLPEDFAEDNPALCFSALLKIWLNRINPPASWEDMINALQSVNCTELAKSMKEKFSFVEAHEECSEPVLLSCNVMATNL